MICYMRCCGSQLVEKILDLCDPRELGNLCATCRFFSKSSIIQSIGKCRISAIPRAKGLQPASR